MQITPTFAFRGSPDRVASMLVNPSFAQHVGAKIKADNVTVTDIDRGLTAVFTVVTPDAARRIMGSMMSVTETVTWSDPSPDGSRKGRLTMSVAGVPASIDGPIDLSPTSTGSDMVYDADFTVRIPLMGRKIEQMAHKYLAQMVETCEQVGNEWLDNNP